MPYTNEVIKYFRRKDATDFEPISWLGAEQRFVGPLRNSNLNNLEEQYIIGTDTYIINYTDNEGNRIREEHFCMTGANGLEDATDYYKLVSTIYQNPYQESNIHFDQGGLVFSQDSNVVFGGGSSSTYTDPDSVYFIGTNKYSFDEDGGLQMVESGVEDYIRVRQDILYFVKKNQPDLLVLTKLTEEKYLDNNRTIIRERIINALDPSKQ